jgi:hypothetical protein
MEPKVSLKVTPAEYHSLLRSRIEHVLTAADVPPKIVAALVDCFSRMTTEENPEIISGSSTSRTNTDGTHADERQKPHWLRPGQRPIDKPKSVGDAIVNALYSKKICTAPELATITKKPIKAIYTNLWRLKKEGVIDIGAVPDRR